MRFVLQGLTTVLSVANAFDHESRGLRGKNVHLYKRWAYPASQDAANVELSPSSQASNDPCPTLCKYSTPSKLCYNYGASKPCQALSMRWCPEPSDDNYNNQCNTTMYQTQCTCDFDSPVTPVCGDGHCQRGETCESCPQDCAFVDKASGWSNCTVWRGCPGLGREVKAVHMSFNDGPSTYTSRLLDYLKEADVKASFFVIGMEMRKHLNTTSRMIREGHSLQSMGFSQWKLEDMSKGQIGEELGLFDFETYELFGFKSGFFRAPFDMYTNNTFYTLLNLSYPLHLPNLDPSDLTYASDPYLIYSRTKDLLYNDNAFSSFVYLGHDTTHGSVEIIPNVIKLFKNEGYKMVSLEECLYGNTTAAAKAGLHSQRTIPMTPVRRILASDVDIRIQVNAASRITMYLHVYSSCLFIVVTTICVGIIG